MVLPAGLLRRLQRQCACGAVLCKAGQSVPSANRPRRSSEQLCHTTPISFFRRTLVPSAAFRGTGGQTGAWGDNDHPAQMDTRGGPLGNQSPERQAGQRPQGSRESWQKTAPERSGRQQQQKWQQRDERGGRTSTGGGAGETRTAAPLTPTHPPRYSGAGGRGSRQGTRLGQEDARSGYSNWDRPDSGRMRTQQRETETASPQPPLGQHGQRQRQGGRVQPVPHPSASSDKNSQADDNHLAVQPLPSPPHASSSFSGPLSGPDPPSAAVADGRPSPDSAPPLSSQPPPPPPQQQQQPLHNTPASTPYLPQTSPQLPQTLPKQGPSSAAAPHRPRRPIRSRRLLPHTSHHHHARLMTQPATASGRGPSPWTSYRSPGLPIDGGSGGGRDEASLHLDTGGGEEGLDEGLTSLLGPAGLGEELAEIYRVAGVVEEEGELCGSTAVAEGWRGGALGGNWSSGRGHDSDSGGDGDTSGQRNRGSAEWTSDGVGGPSRGRGDGGAAGPVISRIAGDRAFGEHGAAAVTAMPGVATAAGTTVAVATKAPFEKEPLRRSGGFFADKAQLLAPLYHHRRAKSPVTTARLLGMSAAYTTAQATQIAAQLGLPPGGYVGSLASGAAARDGAMPYRYGIGGRGQIVDLVRQARDAAAAAVPERVRRRLLAVAAASAAAGDEPWVVTGRGRGRAAASVGPLGERDEDTDWDEVRDTGLSGGQQEEPEDEFDDDRLDALFGEKEKRDGDEEGMQEEEEEKELLVGEGLSLSREQAATATAAAMAPDEGKHQQQDALLAVTAPLSRQPGAGQSTNQDRGAGGAAGEGRQDVSPGGTDEHGFMYGGLDLPYNCSYDDADDAFLDSEGDDDDDDDDGGVDDLLEEMLFGAIRGSDNNNDSHMRDDDSSDHDRRRDVGGGGDGEQRSSGGASDDLKSAPMASPTATAAAEDASPGAQVGQAPGTALTRGTAAAVAVAGTSTGADAAVSAVGTAIMTTPNIPVAGEAVAAAPNTVSAAEVFERRQGRQQVTAKPSTAASPPAGPPAVRPRSAGGYLAFAPEGWQQYGRRSAPLPLQPSTADAGGTSTRGPVSKAGSGGSGSSNGVGTNTSTGTGGSGGASQLVLRAFLYCIGQHEVYDALWRTDLLDRLKFVTRMRDADIVLHRAPAPGEKQFALEKLSRGARAARIPFITVRQATEEQLAPALERALRRFGNMYDKVVSEAAAGISREGPMGSSRGRGAEGSSGRQPGARQGGPRRL